MSDREAMKLALSVLKGYANYPHSTKRVSMLEHARGVTIEAITALEKALAAPEPMRHPGYLIGNHWLETAYSRVCAGEVEADVLRDCGWERVTDAEALRRENERLTDEQIDSATSKERDDLLDHIYEYGTAAEGILERIRKLARAAIDAAMQEDKT